VATSRMQLYLEARKKRMTIRHWNQRVDQLSLQLGIKPPLNQTHPQFMDMVMDMMNVQDALRRSQDADTYAQISELKKTRRYLAIDSR